MSKYNYFDDDDVEVVEHGSRSNVHSKKEIFDAVKAFSQKNEQRAKRIAHSVADNISTATKKVHKTLAEYEAEESRRHRKQKLIGIAVSIALTIIIFVIMILAVVHSINSETKRIQQFNADAGKICSEYSAKYGNCNYENLYGAYQITGYRMKGLCYAREMDFDNDSVSELLICYFDGDKYYVEVYGYNKDKKFVSLYKGKAAQTKKVENDVWITIYSHNNKYYIGEHSKDLKTVKLYMLKGEEFEEKQECTYDLQTQEFTIKDEVDFESFERIKLSVLTETKANVISELVGNTLDEFSRDKANSSAVSGASSMNSAYSSVIQEYVSKYGLPEYVKKDGLSYINGLAVADLVDFNGDDKKELMLIYRKEVLSRGEDAQGNFIVKADYHYYLDIYQYSGSKAKLVFQKENISESLNDVDDLYFVLKKQDNKVYYCSNSFSTSDYGRVVDAVSHIYRLGKNGFDEKFKSSYYTNYGYTSYYINGERVYNKSEFDRQGYQVALFNGSETYNKDLFTVNFLQRKTKNASASEMEERVSKTKSNISKIGS